MDLVGRLARTRIGDIHNRVLAALGVEDDVLLWNVVPTHPGTAATNRRPGFADIAAGLSFLREIVRRREGVTGGRVAAPGLGRPAVRHPSHGGAKAFEDGLRRRLAS